MTQYLIIVGNPVDGLSFFGPFKEPDEALKFGEENAPESEWWMAHLMYPTIAEDDGENEENVDQD